MAKIAPAKATTSATPPTNPVQPAALMRGQGAGPGRRQITTNSTGTSARDRYSRICQVVALSTNRIARPISDHSKPASITSTTPRR